MKLRRKLKFFSFFLFMNYYVFAAETEAEKTDLCAIMQAPREYSGRFVSVFGRLDRGDVGEWYLTVNNCVYLRPDQVLDLPGPVLILAPYQVKPHPGFFLDSHPVAMLFMKGCSGGFDLHARFEGRIDWSGTGTKSGERIRRKALYGREKVPWRMILRKVSDVDLRTIPIK